MNDLLKQQKQLQEEAHEVLKNIKLLSILTKYGIPFLVGSVETGLMAWKDIDLEVIVKNINKDLIAEITSSLIRNSARRLDFSIVDNRNPDDSGKGPIGYYIGLKYYDPTTPKKELVSSNKNTWKIDLWLVLEGNARSDKSTEDLKAKLNSENRQIILDIKNQIMEHPLYRYEIFSTDIYSAVLENNVTNIEEFKSYLNKIGKNYE